MTIQFLILRIQSILDGKANASDAQLRAIASEYMRICQNAERKLLHCASLIRAGRDYAAFQVAETQPMLLETLNELIFSRLEDWRNFCSIHTLPCPSPFDENQISLVKSLYTREISQNHPLYRDYRRAMRMHNYEEALSIISTIVKVNGSNSEAKNELEKLSRRIATQKFEAAKAALASGDLQSAIKTASDIREYADDIFSSDEDWKNLSSKIDDYEKQNAAKRISEIFEALRSSEIADDYRKILEFAAETDVLTSKFEIELNAADQDYLRAQTKRALFMQDEANAAEAKAQALLDIASEIEHPSDMPPKQSLEKILKLKKAAGNSIEPEMAKRLSKTISALRFKITISRLKKAGLAAAVICLAVAAFFEIQKRERLNTQYRSVANAISAIQNMQNTRGAMQSLESLKKAFPQTCALAEFSDKIETIENTLALKTAYLKKFESFKNAAEKFDKKSDDLAYWLEMQNELGAADSQADILDGAEYSAVKMEISSFANAFSNAISAKRAANSAKLNALIDLIQRETALANVHDSGNIQHIKNAKDALQKARALAENPSIIFAISPERTEKLQEAAQELEDKANLAESFGKSLALIKSASSAEEYFEALKELSQSPALSPKDAGSIEKILAAKDAVLFEVYGGIIDKNTAEEAPEKFSAPSINFYDFPEIAKIHKATSNGKTYYMIDKPEERNRVWNGGGEVIQKANIVSDSSGKAKETAFSRITFKNHRPNGYVLEGIKLAKEAETAEKAAEISDKKSLSQALVFAANSDANPIFKAWLEKRILDAFRQSPIKSGFAFSKTLQNRAKKIDAIAADLTPYSWIFETDSRANFVKSELYGEELKDPMPEAYSTKEEAQKSLENPMKIVGFGNFEGNIASSENLSGKKLYGITITGDFGELSQTKKPAKLTPIFVHQEK